MMKLSTVLVLIFTLSFAACQKEWKDPDKTIPAMSVDIVSILATPIVYDRAGVIVKGMVWSLETVIPEPEVKNDIREIGEIDWYTMLPPEPYIRFKLADRNGNYVEVIADDRFDIQQGDILEVTGIFDKKYSPEESTFHKQIEAKSITVISSLRERYGNSY